MLARLVGCESKRICKVVASSFGKKTSRIAGLCKFLKTNRTSPSEEKDTALSATLTGCPLLLDESPQVLRHSIVLSS